MSERQNPSIYPYPWRCGICREQGRDYGHVATEANLAEVEADMKRHMADHRKREKER